MKSRPAARRDGASIRSALPVAMLFTILMTGHPPRAGAENESYVASGEQILVRISPRQIGVSARMGVRDNLLVAALADTFHMSVVDTIQPHLLIFARSDSASTENNVLLAREVKRRLPALVGQAGLVAYGPPNQKPIVATDDFVVQFDSTVTPALMSSFKSALQVDSVFVNPYVPNQILYKVDQRTARDVFKVTRDARSRFRVKYAIPNFLRRHEQHSPAPWHHVNTGRDPNGSSAAMIGLPDADLDTDRAWEITRGSSETLIAVIDHGFDLQHPDLTPALWQSRPGCHGWNFYGCDYEGRQNCGTCDVSYASYMDNLIGMHGTPVSGIVAGRGIEAPDMKGVCPECMLMLIEPGFSDLSSSLAIGFATSNGASVILNSYTFLEWAGTPDHTTTALDNAHEGRTAKGCVLIWPMSDAFVNDCGGRLGPIYTHPNVIAVSASTNRDTRASHVGFGDCMTVLAPAADPWDVPVTNRAGTLNVVAADVSGGSGYNTVYGSYWTGACPSQEPAADRDYTVCFGGTSAAAPMVAGIAGLVLSVDPGLTDLEVKRIIADTADRIEPRAEMANYDPNTGFSRPTAQTASTYGYGRANAFEAVRAALPSTNGRGIDLFVRDNSLDWGNTEQPSNTRFEQDPASQANPTRGFIAHWTSVDIKVDSWPYLIAPTTSRQFDELSDENPSTGPSSNSNRVYVRVRNRGPQAASNVKVKLYWAQIGAACPPLPPDFWSGFATNSFTQAEWHWIGEQQIALVPYSGSYAENNNEAPLSMVRFDWLPTGQPNEPNHYCLLLIVDSADDHVGPLTRVPGPEDFIVDQLTPNDNNVTHRNYQWVSTATNNTRFKVPFYVRNAYKRAYEFAINHSKAPDGWDVRFDSVQVGVPFPVDPEKGRRITMLVRTRRPRERGVITVRQERVLESSRGSPQTNVAGGVTVLFAPPPRKQSKP